MFIITLSLKEATFFQYTSTQLSSFGRFRKMELKQNKLIFQTYFGDYATDNDGHTQ